MAQTLTISNKTQTPKKSILKKRVKKDKKGKIEHFVKDFYIRYEGTMTKLSYE